MRKFSAVSYNSILIFALFAFVSVSVLGLGHSFGMEMNEKGEMQGCLLTGHTAICTMTFAEHLGVFQGMFTATAQKVGLLSLLILFLAVVFKGINSYRNFHVAFFGLLASRAKLYLKANPDLLLYNPLREAFSQGILHSRVYA